MCPDVYKSVVVNYYNLTSILDRRQTVRDDHDGSAHDRFVDGFLY